LNKANLLAQSWYDWHDFCWATEYLVSPEPSDGVFLSKEPDEMLPALFLDRDGVIIENRDTYVRRLEDVSFIPGSLDALARIRPSPFPIIILTNQSAIGRGLITTDQADEINRQILKEINLHGGRIDAIYMCPHTPLDHCSCRKPEPGLFFQAAADFSIDLSRSILIGDAMSDLLAGQNAGLAENVLVLTGRGRDQLHQPRSPNLKPFLFFSSLSSALDHFSRFIIPTSNGELPGPIIR
jgi:D-glycero-D-manno-heptose 1,7-bisphosphate phosphatase